MSLSESIKQSALAAGFNLAGVAPLDAGGDLEFARHWVEKGFGGNMGYLANPKRRDPRLVLPSVKSVVCVGLIYNAPFPYSTEATGVRDSGFGVRNPTPAVEVSIPGQRAGDSESERLAISSRGGESRTPNPESRTPRGWISRYAWGRDYHETMRARLEKLRAAIEHLAPGVETRVYVDTGPIVERAFARLSGIGWMGKNTCLINQQRGSWFFLGVILTSLDLTPDRPAFDRCGSCTHCLEACPTGALVAPYVMDASRCIAYFNIELKGSIPAEFRPAVGANVFGCDICQDVCPWNRDSGSGVRVSGSPALRRTAVSVLPEFQPLTIEPQPSTAAAETRTPDPEPRAFTLFNPPLEALASLTEADFRCFFAHSPVKRVKYRGWLRNLCLVMGNSGDAGFVPWLERAREDPDAVVREHAEWALEQLINTDKYP